MIAVDWTRCDGHGLCAALAPELVKQDEWGYPILTGAVTDKRTERRLVAVCPALALRVEKTQPLPMPSPADSHRRLR